MVHFPGFARARLWIHRAVTGFYPVGFPHSEIPGSKPACGSPRLIAACHVLHRLLLPRHPPCALSSLTTKFTRYTAASVPSPHTVIPSGASVSRSGIDAQSGDPVLAGLISEATTRRAISWASTRSTEARVSRYRVATLHKFRSQGFHPETWKLGNVGTCARKPASSQRI